MSSKTQPNIILIEADQMAAFPLSFYNQGGQAITPNLDKLAAEGVVFENAYSNSPLCCPSRASKFTGRLPSTHEVWGNGAEFASDMPTMMHFLRSSGYRTVVSGKCHFIGADQLHGFDKRLTTDMYPSSFDWTIDWRPKVDHRLGTSVSKLAVSGLCKTNNQILYDAEVQFRAIEFLRYEVMEPKESPFFLHVSYTQPHESYQSVPKYLDLYDDVEIDMPKLDHEPIPNPVTDWLHVHHGVDQFAPSKERVRESRRAYYAMISALDEYIGELVAELKHLDLYDNTIIVFTSDHGDMMGEHNMWFKRTFHEKSAQVPMIFHAPSRFKPGRIDAPVTLADLCPTLSELGGAKDAADRYGSPQSDSFACLFDGRPNAWRNTAVMEYFGPGVEAPWLSVRRGDFKYSYIHGWGGILVNLAEDPDETTNLVNASDHAGLVAELHALAVRDLDLDAMVDMVVENKKTRLWLNGAMKGSEGYVWDYTPDFDGSRRYVRGSVNKPTTA